MPECNALKNHMCINNTGSWIPCCRFQNPPHFDASTVPFSEYKSSKFYKRTIKDMTTGWANECVKCKQEELNGIHSLRSTYNNILTGGEDIEYIELSISNECNLMCRMCSPMNSSSWNRVASKNDIKEYIQPVENKVININKIFDNADLSKVKRIKYLGGEPFITPQIKELFELLVEKNVIQNIEFEFTTNATLFPNKWLTYLERAKKVNIELSIDGIGKVQSYIRHGKSWDIEEPIIYQWVDYYNKQDNINLSMFTTIQAYNLHDVKNVRLFADSLRLKHYTNLLAYPSYLNIGVLPKKYLEEIKDEYNQKFYSSIEYKNEMFDTFKDFTKKLDKIFNVSLKDVNPLLYEYF